MRRLLLWVMTSLFSVCMLIGCASEKEQENVNESSKEVISDSEVLHKIGVASYAVTDAQVRMFKDYLDHYIKESFSDVTFVYSDSIQSEEEQMAFLAQCADEGVEGIMVFGSHNLKKEVEYCASKEMYYILPSATSSEEVFASVEDNPYFIGEIGPGTDNEYIEAKKMTESFLGDGKNYIILSGGAFMGNEMHRIRTVAILETFQQNFGIEYAQDIQTLSQVSEITKLETAIGNILICPGYLEMESFLNPAIEAITKDTYTTILSVLPATPLLLDLSEKEMEVECGVIDCFSEDNYYRFQKGILSYVAGKYQSEIGPAFAAMYNAITGHGDLYRENGKAFRLVQGFWTAENEAEYDEKYDLSRGTVVNAYNYEDLYSVIKVYNEETSFDHFKELVEAFEYDDCKKRREN